MNKNNSFRTAYPIEVRSKCANVDFLYGPYTSVESACENIPEEVREIGKTVGIILNDSSSIEEYWFKNGIKDSDLVKKLAEANWGEIAGNIENQKDLNHAFVKEAPRGYRLVSSEMIINLEDATYNENSRRGLIKVHDDSDYLIGYCQKNEEFISFFKINVSTKQVEYTWDIPQYTHEGIDPYSHLESTYLGNGLLLIHPIMNPGQNETYKGMFLDLNQNIVISMNDFFGITGNIGEFKLYTFRNDIYLISYYDYDVEDGYAIGYAEKGNGIVQELSLTQEEKENIYCYNFFIASNNTTYAVSVLNEEERGLGMTLNLYEVSNLKLKYITTLMTHFSIGGSGGALISEGYNGNLYITHACMRYDLGIRDVRLFRIDKDLQIHTTILVGDGGSSSHSHSELIKSFIREQRDNADTIESVYTDVLRDSLALFEVNYHVSKKKMTGEEIINNVDVSLISAASDYGNRQFNYGEVINTTKIEDEKGFITDVCFYMNSARASENEFDDKIYQVSQASTINHNVYLQTYEIADTRGDVYMAINPHYSKGFGLMKCKQIEDNSAMFVRSKSKWIRFK